MTNEINTIVATTTAITTCPDLTVHAYTQGMNVSGRTFYNVLAKLKTKVEFDPLWRNGTGYFNDATKVPVPVGEWCWSHDPSTNRFIVLIGTRFGTVTVFERYTHGSLSPVIVSNTPKKGYAIWQLAGLNGQLNERVLMHVLGDPEFPSSCNNIGMQVEQMSQLFLKFNE